MGNRAALSSRLTATTAGSFPGEGRSPPELEELAPEGLPSAFTHHPGGAAAGVGLRHLAARRTEERLPGWKRPAFRWLWLLGDGFSFL